MKVAFKIFSFTILSISLYGQPMSVFDTRVFYDGEQKPYLECYFQFLENSVTRTAGGDAFMEVTQILKKEGEIHTFTKSLVHNLITDENKGFFHMERLSIPPGEYFLEVTLRDTVLGAQNTFQSKLRVKPYDEQSIFNSKIQAVLPDSTLPDLYERSGVKLLPHVSSFYKDDEENLYYYSEIYNSDKVLSEEEKGLVAFVKILDPLNGEIVKRLQTMHRFKAAPVNIVYGALPLSDLPTGKYALKMDVLGQKGDTLLKDFWIFDRLKNQQQYVVTDSVIVSQSFISSVSNIDTLEFFLESLFPIASKQEKIKINNQTTALPTARDKQSFFYYFWLKRNGLHPDIAWQDYYTDVKAVEDNYSTPIRHGYETDRGRVYLQYGAPNTILERYNEASSYPYEIWHYYKLKDAVNRKFVFYDVDFGTNDFILLHSNVFGEVANSRWKVELLRRSSKIGNPDVTQPQDQHGVNSDYYYENPR